MLVFTHDPKFDEPALIEALATDAGFIGALGSRRTQERRVERLRERGLDEDAIARIHAPCGLDVGARTPAETAVSILAEVIAVRSGRAGESLRETERPDPPADGRGRPVRLSAVEPGAPSPGPMRNEPGSGRRGGDAQLTQPGVFVKKISGRSGLGFGTGPNSSASRLRNMRNSQPAGLVTFQPRRIWPLRMNLRARRFARSQRISDALTFSLPPAPLPTVPQDSNEAPLRARSAPAPWANSMPLHRSAAIAATARYRSGAR